MSIAPLDDRTVKANNIIFQNLFGATGAGIQGPTGPTGPAGPAGAGVTASSSSGSFVMNFTTGLSITYTAYKVGNLIVLQLRSGSCTKDATTSQITSSTLLPANLRPTGGLPAVIISGVVNGATQPIGFNMNTGGQLTMYNPNNISSLNFNSSSTIFWNDCTISYI